MREPLRQKMQKPTFLRMELLIVGRRTACENWQKIIYSLTYSTSQVYTKNAAKTELLNWLSS